MPIPITCSACGKSVNAPDHLAGKTVRCPTCKGAITVSEAEPPFGRIIEEKPAEAAMKQCRYCGEDIRAVAKKCKHCGEDLTAPPPARRSSRRDRDDDYDDDEDDRPRRRRGGSAAAAAAASTTVVVQGGGGSSFPHGMHLLITLCTGGFWLPFWIILALCHKG